MWYGSLEIVDDQDREVYKEIKKQKGVEIIPAEAAFCAAKCFHVLVCGKVKGALIIPQVSDYPEFNTTIYHNDLQLTIAEMNRSFN